MNAKAPAFDNAKSLSYNGSMAHWERGMAVSAAVPAVVAEDHGRELRDRGDANFHSARFLRDF